MIPQADWDRERVVCGPMKSEAGGAGAEGGGGSIEAGTTRSEARRRHEKLPLQTFACPVMGLFVTTVAMSYIYVMYIACYI